MSKIFDSQTLLLFDGAMGTELYDRGHYINRPFEELNLSAASDVEAIHRSYIEAGAQVITTNTFAITRPQLKKFDIQDKQEELLRAALEIAQRAVAGTNTQVGLSMGPIGELVEPLGAYALRDAANDFSQVARLAMSFGRYDFYILETFTNISELNSAIDGIRSVDSERPILASIAVHSSQAAVLSDFIAVIASRSDVQALGLNCSQGPSDLLSSLQKLRPQTSKPIVVQPNAGVPRQINGRYFYMTSPDYLAKFAKRYVEAGANGVGGCCGTGPSHIQAVRGALAMAKARRQESSAQVAQKAVSSAQVFPQITQQGWGQRPSSRVGQCLEQNKKIYSVEILPPRGTQMDLFLSKLELLQAAGVDFINIPDGARASTRVGSLHAAAAVKKHFGNLIGVIPHLTARDRNLIALQADLLGASVNDIHDLLLITGDPPKLGTSKEATAVYDIDSIGLTYLAHCLNLGVAPNGEQLGRGTSFGIGVAANPTAINQDSELQRWKYKVESGADFAITQPIFDAELYLRWLDSIPASHQRPHLVGIWPLISLRNAEFMANEIPGVSVPAWVLEEMAKAEQSSVSASQKNNEESIKRGLEIAHKVMKQVEPYCAGFCVSAPVGKVEVALKVLKS